MSEDKRRDTRYRYSMPVELRAGRRTREQRLTANVSFRGMFVRTDTPPVLRQLLSVSAALPPDDTPFESHGMAVYVVEPGHASGHVPGVGIQFYAMGDARRPWEAFIQRVRAEDGIQPEGDDHVVDAIRRRHRRYEIVLEVVPRTVEELVSLYTRDVSTGGMYIETQQDLDLGLALGVEVSHPGTNLVFPLDCVVTRRGGDGEPPGVGVEFDGMTLARTQAFYDFVVQGLPEELRETVELVPPEDPSLE